MHIFEKILKLCLVKKIVYSHFFLWIFGLFRNWRECLLGIAHFFKLIFFKIPPKTILIVEPNKFHGECLPGYVKYFWDLGYQVIILCRYSNYNDNPFCRFTILPIRYCLPIFFMKCYLLSKKIREFEFVLVASSVVDFFEYKITCKYLDFLGRKPVGKLGYGIIEHDLSFCLTHFNSGKIPDKNSEYYDEIFNHTFVLTGFSVSCKEIPMINPHYFGRINTDKHLSRGKKIFLAVGSSMKHPKTFSQLFESLEKLPLDYEYEIRVIGNIHLKSVPDCLQRKIIFLGRLTFNDMYRNLEDADFFLPLFSPELHLRYLGHCTSGSRQLILGFNLIAIMHRQFAEHYGLNNCTTILYDDDNKLIDAFIRAFMMSDFEYQKMKIQLEKLRCKIADISMENIRKRLKTSD